MLSLLIVIAMVSVLVENDARFTRARTPASIQESFGSKAGFILGYRAIGLGLFTVVFPEYADLKSVGIVPVSNGSQKQKFLDIVRAFSTFNYVGDQPDPTKVMTKGGNCQAISLALYENFKTHGFKTGLVLDYGIEHMFLWVDVDGTRYDVDLVKKYVQPHVEKE